jgi:hypothetical protein
VLSALLLDTPVDHVLPLLSVIEVIVCDAAAATRQPTTRISPVPAAVPVAVTV